MEWFVVDEVSAGLRRRPVRRWQIISSRCVQSVARNSRLLIAISVTKVGHEDCHLDFFKGRDVGNCCNLRGCGFWKGILRDTGVCVVAGVWPRKAHGTNKIAWILKIYPNSPQCQTQRKTNSQLPSFYLSLMLQVYNLNYRIGIGF